MLLPLPKSHPETLCCELWTKCAIHEAVFIFRLGALYNSSRFQKVNVYLIIQNALILPLRGFIALALLQSLLRCKATAYTWAWVWVKNKLQVSTIKGTRQAFPSYIDKQGVQKKDQNKAKRKARCATLKYADIYLASGVSGVMMWALKILGSPLPWLCCLKLTWPHC